ncbi:vegetative incompatibility protein HET-E-1 [Colletotrichum tabaci]|uniref:Vegetative incompatibility protein HET-E-1 n=1 Tax=Colletotrichum tabaci TaxID=1209068 RepID=A0AAV9TM29_9PEZI
MEEDTAYCLLGLFGISMPLLYGEGSKAFARPQEEIIKPLLAPSPEAFQGYAGVRWEARLDAENGCDTVAYYMTNAGLSIRLPVLVTMAGYIVALNGSRTYEDPAGNGISFTKPWIPVLGKITDDILCAARQPVNPVFLSKPRARPPKGPEILVSRREYADSVNFRSGLMRGFLWSTSASKKSSGVFPIFPSGTESLRDAWVSGFDQVIYGINVIWLDFDSSDSKEIRAAVVRTSIEGSRDRATRATIWFAAKVGKRGQASGWSCQILRRDDTLTSRDIEREMMPYI